MGHPQEKGRPKLMPPGISTPDLVGIPAKGDNKFSSWDRNSIRTHKRTCLQNHPWRK